MNPEPDRTIAKCVRIIVTMEIPGDIVECGVYEGDRIVTALKTLLDLSVTDRDVYLYDTFSGMTEPGPHDAKVDGSLTPADVRQKYERGPWCAAGLEIVRTKVLRTGYPAERIHFVEGDVRQTLPNTRHSAIALLRLDTDFYDSTLHELTHLYPLVSPGGAVIIDDYGSWRGQQKAVDEYFGKIPMIETCRKERYFIK